MRNELFGKVKLNDALKQVLMILYGKGLMKGAMQVLLFLYGKGLMKGAIQVLLFLYGKGLIEV